jgi:hypothetical protein
MIAVIGGEGTTEADARHAYEVGRELGRRGHVLVCGGHGGVMLEACRGAREAGGHTIGILPEEDASRANEFVEFPIVTGMGAARNVIVARTADAVIAIGGRYGTLSEIAFAFIAGKPVAGIGTWALALPDGESVPVVATESAAAAVDVCEAAARRDAC